MKLFIILIAPPVKHAWGKKSRKVFSTPQKCSEAVCTAHNDAGYQGIKAPLESSSCRDGEQ